mgnify:CR=1 FL=1
MSARPTTAPFFGKPGRTRRDKLGSMEEIFIRDDMIRLGQFLKLANLVEDGAQARIAIQSGDVTVNGAIETRRGHHLADGDVVVVDHPADQVGAAVKQLGPGQ